MSQDGFHLRYGIAELEPYIALRSGMSEHVAIEESALPAQDLATSIEHLDDEHLVLRRRATAEDLRPGKIWAGPSIVSLVDTAGFLLTVAHLPAGSDALTIELGVRFLRPAPFSDLRADARLLRISHHSSYATVEVTSLEGCNMPVVHATISFVPRPAP